MYMERISIQNFRAVKNMEIAFTRGVNLLIGDNGAGKTSVLEAIAVALSGILRGIKGVSVKGIMHDDIRFSFAEKGDASSEIHYEVPVEISCRLKWGERDFYWKRFRLHEGAHARTKTEDDGIEKWIQNMSNDPDAVLPLFCFQSDARVWQASRGDYGLESKKALNDRRCGYIGCLDYSLDLKGIQAWCLKMELNAFQKKHEIKEYEDFKNTIAVFMKNINDLETAPDLYYSGQLEQLVYREDDHAMPISCLSAGYQSLLWMVMNLAYRLALLNPESSKDLREAEGMVLIDEIDMHLHPKWQWKIVNALEETFPNIQFILATHSPIVISSCKNEQLIMIAADQEILYLEDAYGYSVQDVLNYRQGTAEKPREIKALFGQFEEALEQDEWSHAEELIGKMENILGQNHPDLRGAKDELWLNRQEGE